MVSTPVGVDEGAQSVTFAGDLPEGGYARLTRSSTRTPGGQRRSLLRPTALQGMPGPSLAVSVSCVARRIVLGQHTDDEVEAVASRLPAGAVHVGFYSYGEIAPVRARQLRPANQTMTITAYERWSAHAPLLLRQLKREGLAPDADVPERPVRLARSHQPRLQRSRRGAPVAGPRPGLASRENKRCARTCAPSAARWSRGQARTADLQLSEARLRSLSAVGGRRLGTGRRPPPAPGVGRHVPADGPAHRAPAGPAPL